jgi:hypothetical protein
LHRLSYLNPKGARFSMDERAEKCSTWLSFVITSLGLLGALLYIPYLLCSNRPLEITRLQTLPTYLPGRFTKADLLFSPSGAPVVVVENSTNVDVFTWKLDEERLYRSSKVPIPLGQLAGLTQPVELLSPFTTAASTRSVPSRPGLAYAISADATMVAWSWGGYLYAGPLTEPRKTKRRLTVPSPVADISFLGPDLVGILHSTGELRLERLSRRDPDLPGTELGARSQAKEPWRLSGRGPFGLLSRLGTGYGILINPDDKQSTFQNFPATDARTFIATSPGGQVVIGTSTGTLFFPVPFGQASLVVLPETGKVQALAFYDEQRVIAGVEGGSLFLVEDKERVNRLDAAPADVQLLALQGSRIAMATSRSISIGTLERHMRLSDQAKWQLALTFSILGGLGFLRLWGQDLISLNLINLCLQRWRPRRQDNKDVTPESGKGGTSPGTEGEAPAPTEGSEEQPQP